MYLCERFWSERHQSELQVKKSIDQLSQSENEEEKDSSVVGPPWMNIGSVRQYSMQVFVCLSIHFAFGWSSIISLLWDKTWCCVLYWIGLSGLQLTNGRQKQMTDWRDWDVSKLIWFLARPNGSSAWHTCRAMNDYIDWAHDWSNETNELMIECHLCTKWIVSLTLVEPWS